MKRVLIVTAALILAADVVFAVVMLWRWAIFGMSENVGMAAVLTVILAAFISLGVAAVADVMRDPS